MAVWAIFTPEQNKMYAEWIASRPEVIRNMVAKYDLRPDKVYHINSSQKRYVLHSFEESGTVTMKYLLEHNRDYPIPAPPVTVFNVKPENLKEADYPFKPVDGSLFPIDDSEAGKGTSNLNL